MVNTVSKNLKLKNIKDNATASPPDTKFRSPVKYKTNISKQTTASNSAKSKLSVTSVKTLNKKRPAPQNQPTQTKVKKNGIDLPKPDVLHSYLSYGEIMQYFNYLKGRYSDLVTVHVLGYSYENRAIKGIEIDSRRRRMLSESRQTAVSTTKSTKRKPTSKPAECPEERNMIFIEGGTHAREWLSISMALYCIYQLTENYSGNRDLLDKLRFFIVPLVNPDGYEYSRKTNRRWRKNRRPHTLDRFIGTDCNRNFDFHWKQCVTLTKLNTYQGEKPFSEPETRALASMLHKLQSKLLLFLSLHSYGQSIMYPWGYTNVEAENMEMLYELAMVASKSIKSLSGRYYQIGSIAQVTRRNISGSVVDYAYGVVHVPFAFVIELPSKEYGFQPPTRLIASLSRETWFGIHGMCKHAPILKGKFEEERRRSSIIQSNHFELPPVSPSSFTHPLLKQFTNLNSNMDDSYCTECEISLPLTTMNGKSISK